MIDYTKTFTWFAKDPRFTSILTRFSLLLLSCILILPIFYVVPLFSGYMIELIRNIQKKDYTLPDINPSTQWQEGLTVSVITIGVGFMISIVNGIFLVLVHATFGESSIAGNSLTSFVNLVVSLGSSFVGAVLYATFAKTKSLQSTVSVDTFQKVWEQNGTDLVIMLVVGAVASTVVTVIGFIACCVGVLPASVVSLLIMAGLYGQIKVEGIGE